MFRITGSNGKFDGDYATQAGAIEAIATWQKSYPDIEFKVLEIDDDDISRISFWVHSRARDMVL